MFFSRSIGLRSNPHFKWLKSFLGTLLESKIVYPSVLSFNSSVFGANAVTQGNESVFSAVLELSSGLISPSVQTSSNVNLSASLLTSFVNLNDLSVSTTSVVNVITSPSTQSSSISLLTPTATGGGIAVPSTPQNLRVTTKYSNGDMLVEWDAVADADSYTLRVERERDGAIFWNQAHTTNSILVDSTWTATMYNISVYATNTAGDSSASTIREGSLGQFEWIIDTAGNLQTATQVGGTSVADALNDRDSATGVRIDSSGGSFDASIICETDVAWGVGNTCYLEHKFILESGDTGTLEMDYTVGEISNSGAVVTDASGDTIGTETNDLFSMTNLTIVAGDVYSETLSKKGGGSPSSRAQYLVTEIRIYGEIVAY